MKTKNGHIARYLCGAFLAATLIEATTDTGPLICTVDPTCRKMTKDEIELIRPIFGDAVRYQDINIFNRPSLFGVFDKSKIAQAMRNNIYLTENMGPGRYDFGFARKIESGGVSIDDDHAGDFAHEVAHVWQYQKVGLTYSSAPMKYEYSLGSHDQFMAFNKEQQAEIIKSYFEQRRALANFSAYATSVTSTRIDPSYAMKKIGEYCDGLAKYEAKLRQELPITSMNICHTPHKSM